MNEPEKVQLKANPKIKKAIDKLAFLSSDGETRELYQLRLDAQENGEIVRNTARDEGIKEGIEQGKLEGIKSTIKIMLNLGANKETATEQLVQTYALPVQQAQQYVNQYYPH